MEDKELRVAVLVGGVTFAVLMVFFAFSLEVAHDSIWEAEKRVDYLSAGMTDLKAHVDRRLDRLERKCCDLDHHTFCHGNVPECGTAKCTDSKGRSVTFPPNPPPEDITVDCSDGWDVHMFDLGDRFLTVMCK